jgi:hypothetical protein
MAREYDLLPVKYFHVIFTLPEQLNDLCMHHPVAMYNLLFETVWDVLRSFAGDEKWLGARLGAFAILHTWSQTLTLHPHIHLIIPAGGISENGTWKASKSKGKFLFEVTQLSPVFRARFVAGVTIPVKVYHPFRDKVYHFTQDGFADQIYGLFSYFSLSERFSF